MGDSQYGKFMVDAGLGGISSVVSTIPTGAGYSLGERRVANGIEYKLVFNAGNSSIAPGFIAAPILSAGAFSVTVSTVSKSNANLGAAVCVHATVPTGNYFWGAVNGNVGGLTVDATSIPTGSPAYIAANGQVELMPASVVTGNQVVAINLGSAASKTATTGARSGDFYITLE